MNETSKNDLPEKLGALRSSVKDWLNKSQDAVFSFYDRDNHSFLRDSKTESKKISLTTTARCYMALAYSSRQLQTTKGPNNKNWTEELSKFLDKNPYEKKGKKFIEKNVLKGDDKQLNNFEIAHLADFIFSEQYADRFDLEPYCAYSKKDFIKGQKKIKQYLNRLIKPKNLSNNNKFGQLSFDNEKPDSKHFFVTLHVLRALSIFSPEENHNEDAIKNIVAHAKQFCIEQCFYNSQKISHLQDPARLVFAGAVYCLYGKHLEKDLVCAIINTLSDSQGKNGTWATTHPIIRGSKLVPWYIASHEIALCLTWLYFQPSVPDKSRTVLLSMMKKYFEGWLIPTYQQDMTGDGMNE